MSLMSYFEINGGIIVISLYPYPPTSEYQYTDNLGGEQDKEAKYTYDLTAGINNLMVYLDIVSHLLGT